MTEYLGTPLFQLWL